MEAKYQWVSIPLATQGGKRWNVVNIVTEEDEDQYLCKDLTHLSAAELQKASKVVKVKNLTVLIGRSQLKRKGCSKANTSNH